MKTKKLIIGLLTLSSPLSLHSQAQSLNGREVGNGGGAWVCEKQTGELRAGGEMLVDIFEAQAIPLNLQLAPYEGSAPDIVKQVMAKAQLANPNFAAEIQKNLDRIHNLEEDKIVVSYTKEDITPTKDLGLHKLTPNADEHCIGGKIEYGQIVNFDDTNNTLLVQESLLNGLSETDRAGLILHEAVYKYIRSYYHDPDSARSREVVGYLFSTLSATELKQKLYETLGGGINAVGMEFQAIEAGSFMMGSPENEPGHGDATERVFFWSWIAKNIKDWEKIHSVTIPQSFEMQTTPVTQKQYYDGMKGNVPERILSLMNGKDCAPENFYAILGSKSGGFCENLPMVNIGLGDTKIFIDTINAKHDGYIYRLPSNEESEYATRAGTSTAYFFGDDPSQLSLYAWFDKNSEGKIHEVKQLRENPWHLYDMMGNIWEWTGTYIYYDFYPVDGLYLKGYVMGTNKEFGDVICRGGAWINNASTLRSAHWIHSGYWQDGIDPVKAPGNQIFNDPNASYTRPSSYWIGNPIPASA